VSPWAIRIKVKMEGSYTDAAPFDMSQHRAAVPPPVAPGSTGTGPGSPSAGSVTGNAPRVPRINPQSIDDSLPPPEPQRRSSSSVAFYGEVTVTWESAAPVRLARREPLPAEFERHYAIRVTGIPARAFLQSDGAPAIFPLLNGTTLGVRGRKPLRADYVLPVAQKKSLTFAFPAAGFPLRRENGTVSFSMNVNEMVVKARFDLRTMSFRDLLAV
jgi:hypothetical protein